MTDASDDGSAQIISSNKAEKREAEPDKCNNEVSKRLKKNRDTIVIQAERKNSSKKPYDGRVCNPRGCFKKGCEELSWEWKEKLYEEFCKLDYAEQCTYIINSMQMHSPVKRLPGKEINSRRLFTFRYYLTLNSESDEPDEVCQKTLCDTYHLTVSRIQVIQNKMKNEELIPKETVQYVSQRKTYEITFENPNDNSVSD